VAHAYNPGYSRGTDQEDQSSKPAQANSSGRPYLEKPFTKTGLVEWLKVKTLSSNPSTKNNCQSLYHHKVKEKDTGAEYNIDGQHNDRDEHRALWANHMVGGMSSKWGDTCRQYMAERHLHEVELTQHTSQGFSSCLLGGGEDRGFSHLKETQQSYFLKGFGIFKRVRSGK
jgi:hypothetical protein